MTFKIIELYDDDKVRVFRGKGYVRRGWKIYSHEDLCNDRSLVAMMVENGKIIGVIDEDYSNLTGIVKYDDETGKPLLYQTDGKGNIDSEYSDPDRASKLMPDKLANIEVEEDREIEIYVNHTWIPYDHYCWRYINEENEWKW